MEPHRAFRFGPYHLDVRERRLSRAGTVIPLRIKVFDTLRLLVENGGRLVTRQELLDAVWPGVVVEENNLSHSISVLRKTLGELPNGRPYIETVPRIGYRFTPPVEPAFDFHEPVPKTAPAPRPRQEIRYCNTLDGVRLAYAATGGGPPLVKASNWLTHLDFEWGSPIWRHWWAELSVHHRLVRYDERGNGMS
jgi:DNA-binding winged helix-turn-helix (wHTH) protein